MPASTKSPAPGRVPQSSASRLLKPPTIRVPASPGKSAAMPGSAPASARALAAWTSYPGDGVATRLISTPSSGSVIRTVWVKAASWVLSTQPCITRS